MLFIGIILLLIVAAIIWGLSEKSDPPPSPLENRDWKPGDHGW